MTETVKTEENPQLNKPEISKDEQFRRHVRKMQPRQLLGHLKRRARDAQPNLAGAFAIALKIVYENTAPQLVDDHNHLMPLEKLKRFGRISPGIR